MIQHNRNSQSKKLMQLIDAALVALAFVVGASLRDPVIVMLKISYPPKEVLNEMWWMLVIATLMMPFLLNHFNHYSDNLRQRCATTIWNLVQSSAIMASAIAGLVIFLKLDPSSRLAIGMSFSSMILFLLVRDRTWRRYRRSLMKNSKHRELVMIAGTGSSLDDLLTELPNDVKDYWEIVATFDFDKANVAEIPALLDQHSIQRVVFSVEHTGFRKVAMAIEMCERQGVEAWVHAGFIRTQLARPDFDLLGYKPMLVLRSTPELTWDLFCKEVIDRLGALILILVTLPLWLVAYVGIRIGSPGAPALFIQDRSGRFGRPFRMVKFRTMIAEAEDQLKEVKKNVGNEMEGPVFKLDEDPRVFKFGQFLRKTSIDELPQLINVLMGEMSLVGPRPLPVYEVKEFEEAKHRRRLSVKPGITCTWQVGGRNTITSFEEWVDMDLAYIDSWSLSKDIEILFKTIPAVLFSRGAK